jgi:flagellar basal-body rod modification protein FlgD
MENGDFIAQMAQFSTVSGIEQMNQGLTGLVDQMRQMRIATASNLLGHSVLVPGNLARADADGEIHGVIDLPQASSSTRVSFSDAETGELYHTQNVGAQRAGLVGFSWRDLPPAVIEGRRQIKIDATVNMGEGEQTLGPSIYAKVLAAAAGSDSADGVMLDVQDYGEVTVTDTTRFR